MSDERWQHELEENREREAMEIVQRLDERTQTSGDVLFIAHELGVSKQFNNYLASKRRAA